MITPHFSTIFFLLYSGYVLAQPISDHDHYHVVRRAVDAKDDTAAATPSQVHGRTVLYSSDRYVAEYTAKVHLRDALVGLLDSPSLSDELFELGHVRRTPSTGKTVKRSDEDLQERLEELQDALENVVLLLEQEYGFPMASASASALAPYITPATTSVAQAPSPTSGSAGTSVVSASEPVTTSDDSDATGTSIPASSATGTSAQYTFNPTSRSNNAVYYSQTDLTSSTSLTQVCNDTSIDIIILAFLNDWTGAPVTVQNTSGPTALRSALANVGYPTLNLASNCWAASTAQHAAGASSLIDCVSDGFDEQIAQCQGIGKKVLLSLGGAAGYSDTTLTDPQMAHDVATVVWSLFLGGDQSQDIVDGVTVGQIRPFGSVVLDGIDIDNESGSTENVDTLMGSLRSLFATNPTQTYYLSAAPQCPRPDASIPLSSMQTQADFVWVQFHNNPACNLNVGTGFIQSLQAWSNDLQTGTTNLTNINNGVTSPRLYIGAPAFANAGSGFVGDGEQFRDILEQVADLHLPNLGGVMFWDGSYELRTSQLDSGGETFAQIVKDVLA